MEEEEMIKLDLDGVLRVGKRYQLELRYIGQISRTDANGVFTKQSSNREDHWNILTQFQAMDARKAFPGFDEPSMKAKFSVKIVHPINTVALSNGKETSEEDYGQGWKQTTFATSPLMSSYLLAFSVGYFDYVETRTSNNVRIRLYIDPERLNKTLTMLEVCRDLIEYFQAYFQVPFTQAKLDFLGAEHFLFNGMENWGLVIVMQRNLIFDPAVDSGATKLSGVALLSHEIAHMWFGNLVTTEWWDNLWLNEGFAMFFERVGETIILGDNIDTIDDIIRLRLVEASFASDKIYRSSVHPLKGHDDKVRGMANAIVYVKGGTIVWMLRNVLGENNFRLGLTAYLKTFAHRSVDHMDLFNCLSAVLQEQASQDEQVLDVAQFMLPWVEQVGYPLVSVNRDPQQLGRVLLGQELFRRTPNETQHPRYIHAGHNQSFYIPIWYFTKENGEEKLTWLKPQQKAVEIQLPNQNQNWIVVNPGRKGYYRVNYDHHNWELLADQLLQNKDRIPVEGRYQIVTDAFKLAESENIDYKIALNVSRYLKHEFSHLPWQYTVKSLMTLSSKFRFHPSLQLVKDYLKSLVFPLYRKVYNWNYNLTGQYGTQSDNMAKFILPLACNLGEETCVQEAIHRFAGVMKSCATSEKLDSNCNPYHKTPSVRDAIYCQGIRHGGQEEIDFLLSKLENNTSNYIIRMALACTENLTDYLYISRQLSDKHLGMLSAFCSGDRALRRPMIWNYTEWNINVSIYYPGLTNCAIEGIYTEQQIPSFLKLTTEFFRHMQNTSDEAPHIGESKFQEGIVELYKHCKQQVDEVQKDLELIEKQRLVQWFENALTNT